eukprot:CAMPEP_0116556078 /NCGR_PEP_ID=MMETSP0397-20121206/8497_1 /TAXON_ID=216820 /ORGANISM="Cyclophora tenuis, Strain ECT3854" /LENGTH=178 /DNA_ID=CAMNT_0004081409 /DNA_START=52 /DNA_END=588 /DNA_ORIENTATION=+
MVCSMRCITPCVSFSEEVRVRRVPTWSKSQKANLFYSLEELYRFRLEAKLDLQKRLMAQKAAEEQQKQQQQQQQSHEKQLEQEQQQGSTPTTSKCPKRKSPAAKRTESNASSSSSDTVQLPSQKRLRTSELPGKESAARSNFSSSSSSSSSTTTTTTTTTPKGSISAETVQVPLHVVV